MPLSSAVRWSQVRIDDVFIDQVGGALAVTPEPATMMLMGTGLVTLAGAAGRKRRKR